MKVPEQKGKIEGTQKTLKSMTRDELTREDLRESKERYSGQMLESKIYRSKNK